MVTQKSTNLTSKVLGVGLTIVVVIIGFNYVSDFLGFTSDGVRKDSAAASYQSSRGDISSGSFFSWAQSSAMKNKHR